MVWDILGVLEMLTTLPQCGLKPDFPAILSQNLTFAERAWEFQSNALWDTQ